MCTHTYTQATKEKVFQVPRPEKNMWEPEQANNEHLQNNILKICVQHLFREKPEGC